MPTLAILDGIKITMYYADHEPAHFHAITAEDELWSASPI
jgi:Domain of unknown function (DUF4160)